MKTTKPLYIALGMVLGAAVLALIAAAPNPGVLNVPGVIVRTNGTEIALITSTPGVGQQIKVYSGAANQAQLFVDGSQSYLSLVSGSGSSTAFLKALDGAGNSAFQLQSGASLFNVVPNTPLADIALNLSAIGPTTNYLIWASLNANPQFAVKSASGWTGTGNNVFSDDGSFKPSSGLSIWTNSAGTIQSIPIAISFDTGGLFMNSGTNAGNGMVLSGSSSVFNYGLEAGQNMVANNDIGIFNFGYQTGEGMLSTNTDGVFNIGLDAGQNMQVGTVLAGATFDIFNYGQSSGMNSTILDSFDVFNYGDAAGKGANILGSKVFNFGVSAGEGLTVDHSFDVFNFGEHAGFNSSIVNNSSQVFSYGNAAGQQMGVSGVTDVFSYGESAGKSMALTNCIGIFNYGFHCGETMTATLTDGTVNFGLDCGKGLLEDGTGGLDHVYDVFNYGELCGANMSVFASPGKSFGIFNYGASGGYGTRIDSSKHIFGFGIGQLSNSGITNSDGIFAYGDDSGIDDNNIPSNGTLGKSFINGSQYVFAYGNDTGFSNSIVSSASLTFLGNDASFNVGYTNCTNGFAIGDWANANSDGSRRTLSGVTNFFALGHFAKATNTDDFVIGNSANNYFFPGASATFDGPITAKQGISAGGTLPSYFTNGVQDATLTANTLVGNDSTNKLVSATLAMLTNTAAADGNAAHYWNGQGGWTAPVAGSTNITDNGYTADIRNATVATNLTAGSATINTNLAVNGQSGFGGFAAGSLPSGVAVGYQTYCTDCLTPWGVGDRVEWDGSNWRTMRARVLATTSTNTYILSCTSNALFIATPITECDLFAIGPNGSAPVQYTCLKRTFTSGGSGSAISAQGNKGDYGDAIGFGHGTAVNGYELAITAGMFFYSNNVVAMGGQYELSNDSDGTDNYIAWVGLNTVTTTNQPPASIAAFVYDKWNYLGRTGAGPETNHWLCYISRVGVSNVVDTGLTPIFQASGTTTPYTRLSVVALTNTITFYTNGVACLTTSDMTTIPGAGNELYSYVLMYKTAGSLGRTVYEMNPWYHKRRGNYSRIY